MSDIDSPSNIPPHPSEGTKRVSPTATTSDDSSAQQQSTHKRPSGTEPPAEIKEKSTNYDSAVTLSVRLSSLKQGSKITANYSGIDGQDRPLITSQTGTYVVKYDPKYQAEISKLPPHANLNITILKIDRDIEARLSYQDPARATNTATKISIPVTLELTGLGDAPATVRMDAQENQNPLEQQKIFYQTTGLYRAESIAQQGAQKLKGLPLPTTTTNYTLYEKAVPNQSVPTTTIPRISSNALMAQEQVSPKNQAQNLVQNNSAAELPHKPSPLIMENVATGKIVEKNQIERLLHNNITASVVKNFPKEDIQLPKIVQKYIEPNDLLGNLRAGSNFTLRIESIAIPDTRINMESKENITQNVKTSLTPQNNSPNPEKIVPPKPDFSGIVIAPRQQIIPNASLEILPQAHAMLPARLPRTQMATRSAQPPSPDIQKPNARYSEAYAISSSKNNPLVHDVKTLYVATPVSVIKFESPIALAPGTVINFTLPELLTEQTEHMPTTQQASDPQKAQAEGVPVNKSAGPNGPASQAGFQPLSALDLALPQPLQPLESFIQNWQSLSQIVSIALTTEASTISQSLNNRVPNIQNPAQMTSSMMFFFAALGTKNPARIWLGPEVSARIEAAGQKKILAILDQDMRRIGRLRTETSRHEWRPALIPLHVGSEVTAVPILTRQIHNDTSDKNNNGEDDDGEEKKSATRFIVELELTQFGQIQVDGLLSPKKLNIIIRTKTLLAPKLKTTMSKIYTTALEVSGYTGDLQFKDNIPPELSVRNIIAQKSHMFQPTKQESL